METINNHPIPQKYSSKTDVVTRSLHEFADASQKAYGAVIYLKLTHSDETSTTSIVISKAMVMPIKGMTIPRAELTAAYMMAKLLKYCSDILAIQTLHAWSDSSIVLCWLRKATNSLKTFVSNRVQAIRNLVPNAQWRHIASTSNPADLTSNGLHSEALVKSHLWWEGPPCIKQPISSWPKPQFHLPNDIPETRTVVFAAPAFTNEKPWENYSDLYHALRIIFWCRRFIKNCTIAIENRNKTTHL